MSTGYGVLRTGVVVTDDPGSPLGRSELKGVCGRRRSPDRDAKSKDETASEQVGIRLGGCLDNGSNHDEEGSRHHAGSTTPLVANQSGEERADHVADGIDHEDAKRRLLVSDYFIQ